MNELEAKQVLAEELKTYREKTFTELAELIGENRAYEKITASGGRYQIEIDIFWDSHPGGDILVVGSIDDGGWRAFVPLTDDFIKPRFAKGI